MLDWSIWPESPKTGSIRILSGLVLSSWGLYYNPWSLHVKLPLKITKTLLKVCFQERVKPQKEKGAKKSKFRLSMAAMTETRGRHWVPFSKRCECVKTMFSVVWIQDEVRGLRKSPSREPIRWLTSQKGGADVPREKMMDFSDRTGSPVQPRTWAK